jgi:hypothetical protein
MAGVKAKRTGLVLYCTCCRKAKPSSEFLRTVHGTSYASWCKACKAAKAAERNTGPAEKAPVFSTDALVEVWR